MCVWLHPHLHCLVPAGGLAPDGSRWIRCGKKFFLPVPVLRAKFRGKLLTLLKQAFEQGELRFPGRLVALSDPAHSHSRLYEQHRIKWEGGYRSRRRIQVVGQRWFP